MSYSLRFELGTLTVTVDGVPDSVTPESLDLAVSVFDHYYDDPPAAFVQHFGDLGALGTFPDTKAVTSCNSVQAKVLGVGADGEETKADGVLMLYVPSPTREPRKHPVIAAALKAASGPARGGLRRGSSVRTETPSDRRGRS